MDKLKLILEKSSGFTVIVKIECCGRSMAVKEVCTFDEPEPEGIIKFECRKCRRVRNTNVL